MKYKHLTYDVTILQSKTVGNMISALLEGERNNNLQTVANFLIAQRRKAMNYGVSRKSNSNSRKTTVNSKISKILELKEEE
tara:strand:+ start:600 stop:842 length:243 start_codon:yes stop_codon:yes gene_type:complete